MIYTDKHNMRASAVALAFVLTAFSVVSASPSELDQARVIAQELRSMPKPLDIGVTGTLDPRIPPLLKELKREVREWIARRYATMASVVASDVQLQLLSELKQSGLLSGPRSDDEQAFGSITGLTVSPVSHSRDLQLVSVSYDSYCPSDDSVLLFQRNSRGSWTLLLNSDNRDFTHPWGTRSLLYAGVSPRNASGRFYFFVARTRSYCPSSGSVWGSMEYLVLRPTADPTAPRLLFAATQSIREDEDVRISLERDGCTLESTGNSAAGARLMRTHLLKYSVSGDQVRRLVQPVAANGLDFVEEWLTLPWKDVAGWSDGKQLVALKSWHDKLSSKSGVELDSLYQQRCHAGMLQIALRTGRSYPEAEVFLLVRTAGANTFRLETATTVRRDNCSEPFEPTSHFLPDSLSHHPKIE